MQNGNWTHRFLIVVLLVLGSSPVALSQDSNVINIGSRRELFVDHFLIDSLQEGANLVLHHPTPREIAITFNQPWEGNASGYPSVFKDDDMYRLYYRGHKYVIDDPPFRQAQSEAVCYAESKDGIHWTKPNLGIYKWPGVPDNNIIWMGSPEAHNFAPFKDSNPDCLPEQRYKAIGGTVTSKGLWTFQSADGIHWQRLSKGPVVTKGAFDSHNTIFWDAEHQRYSMYLREVTDGRRMIGLSHSTDFKTWTTPVTIDFPKSPPQQMYTNQILPYARAPHILFGFPTRYVARPLSDHVQQLPPVALRAKLLSLYERVGTDLTDGLFMSSRDGNSFRRWDDAVLRPGPPAAGRWVYGDNYQGYGLFETESSVQGSAPELSMHFEEGVWRNDMRRLRRYTMRLDGIVSFNAPYAGGQLTTKPIMFDGKQLSINYATSAAGSLRTELRDATNQAIPGYALADSNELFGDSTEQIVSWRNGSDVSALAGQPIQLHFDLADGDLYSFQFGN